MRLSALRTVRASTAAALLATAFAAAPAPASAAAPGWPQDGYGAANTGHNPAETAVTPATVAGLRQRWTITAPDIEDACNNQIPPVVADGRLFTTGPHGVTAYRADTGAPLWTRTFADPRDEGVTTLAVAGATLLVAQTDCQSQSDPDGALLALDVTTGALRWSRLRDAPNYAMVVDKGYVVVAGHDAGHAATTAYRVVDGAPAWNRFGVSFDPGVSSGGRLLLSRWDTAGADSVEIATGAVRWSTGSRWTAVAADAVGTRFYVTDPEGRLRAVSATSGRVVWTIAGAAGQIAIDGQRVYVGAHGRLSAYDAAGGALRWRTARDGAAGRPVVAGGVVYLLRLDEVLAARRADTGAYAGFVTATRPAAHAVVVDGRLYVTDRRTLRAFTL